MEQPLLIRATNLWKSYFNKSGAKTDVIKGLSFDVRKGEFISIMGASGAGKSTLLHLIGSLDMPDKGTIELYTNGDTNRYEKLSSVNIARIRNKNIGFIFQFHHLLPEFTAIENIMMPALIAGKNRKDTLEDGLNLLRSVGLEDSSDKKPMQLSGGEQQRIAVARALINRPDLVLADEPTGNLDSANAESLLNLLEGLRKEYSITLIMATHSTDVANRADRHLHMKDGLLHT
jgi:lipoprotein-releasing system ATP-binding protein